MRSVGVAGRRSAAFRRALERGSLLQAESNARLVNAQTGKSLPLGDALGLLLLMAQERDDRFVRAALRWHARFETELRDLTLAESLLALSALVTVDLGDESGDSGQLALAAVCRHHGLEPARILGASRPGGRHPSRRNVGRSGTCGSTERFRPWS